LAKKLTSDLVQITDPTYSDTGLHLQSKKNTLRLLKVLIPADKVVVELNISKPLSQPIGDHIYVSIISNKLYEVNIIDPYITKITGLDEKYTLYGWVDINNIEKIASLEGISRISISYPPITHTSDENNSVTTCINRTQITIIQTTPNATFYSISTTSAFLSSVPTTPSSPLAVIGTFAALMVCAGIIILNQRSAKRR
jgi:hypothetical protein